MSIGSLFAGIGGFDLAARWMGWRTAWFSEIEPYASAVLKKHWPNVPNHGDITQIKGDAVERVDILCGGFPCQDISVAGKGAGLSGARSGLWAHYARLIEEIRPRYVVAENVSVLRSRGLDQVLREISALGYDAEWHCIPASAVGAPHRRDRIWIIAHSNADVQGPQGRQREGVCERPGEWPVGTLGAFVAHANGVVGDERRVGHASESEGRRDSHRSVECANLVVNTNDTGCGKQRRPVANATELSAAECSSWWSAEPNVGRVANGIPGRVDRLRCLGNAIVPQVAHVLFQAIERRESLLRSGMHGAGVRALA